MQRPFVMLLIAILVQYLIALACFRLMSGRSIVKWVALWAAVGALAASPLIIPREHIPLRAAAAFLGTDWALRLIDCARQHRQAPGRLLTWSTYCGFLIPFPVLLVVFNLRNRRVTSAASRVAGVWRVLFGGATQVAVVYVVLASRSNAALQSSFLLDHAVKALLLVVFIESSSQFSRGVERLAGFDAIPFVNNLYLSSTPADFWRRYNQRVRMWLTLNVFLPSGGRLAPAKGIAATFLFSALLHELMFGIATSRFTGYQALFFLLQAPAVIFSRHLERLAEAAGIAGQILARGLTILWMAATSIFFFHGLNLVIPFLYASRPWLP